MLFASGAWGATTYVKKISTTVYYDASATSCDDVTVADTSGDLEDTIAADLNLFVCEGTYTDANLDSADNKLDISSNSVVITGVGTVVFNSTTAVSPLYINSVDDTVVDNIDFQGGTVANITIGPHSSDMSGTTIRNCSFTGVNGIEVKVDNNTVSSVSIVNNTFSTLSLSGVLITQQDGVAHTFNISNNTFTSVKRAMWIFGTEANMDVGGVAWSGDEAMPYGIDFNSNYVKTTGHAFVTILGLLGTTQSYIRNNEFYDSGAAGTASINGLQIHYTDGLIVEDNIISKIDKDHAVDTSVCDGHGIILDQGWGFGYCRNMIVRRNQIQYIDTDTCSNAAGIMLFQAQDTEVYRNKVSDSHVGYRIVNEENTGNSFYNNTSHANTWGASLADEDLNGVPASTWKNNIFSTNTFGFHVADNSTEPTLSNNLWFGNSGCGVANCDRWNTSTVDTFAAGSGAVEADPLFRNVAGNNFELKFNSPAKDTGTDVGLSGPFCDSGIDIGYKEYCNPVIDDEHFWMASPVYSP